MKDYTYLFYFRETNNSVAMATLTCEEEVFSFDFHVEDSVIKLAVVSHEGSLYLYQFPLSPLPPPPISCSNLVQFVSAPQKVNLFERHFS